MQSNTPIVDSNTVLPTVHAAATLGCSLIHDQVVRGFLPCMLLPSIDVSGGVIFLS